MVVGMIRWYSGVLSINGLLAAAGARRLELRVNGTVLVRPGRGGELELVIWVIVGVYVAVGVFGRPLADVYACDSNVCMSAPDVGEV